MSEKLQSKTIQKVDADANTDVDPDAVAGMTTIALPELSSGELKSGSVFAKKANENLTS